MNIHVSKRRSIRLSSFHFRGSAAQNGGLSLFNIHSARPANYLKTKDLRKKTLLTQNFESREAPKTQNVRRKIRPIICPLSRQPYTPHAAETAPTCYAAKPYTM